MAVADELAAAADLVKGKLCGRPIAVVRGLGQLLGHAESSARELFGIRPRTCSVLAARRRCWPRR